VKVGVILPTFRDDADDAIETAHRAEALGLDGVFCYDHLWPMGQPDRPALAPFPILGLLAATTSRLTLGTLVARVGLVPDRVLVSEFATLDLLAPGRVIAGLGTGDRLSAAENRAYGIDFAPVAERLTHLRHCAATLRARGITVWLGGRRATTSDMAQQLGVAVNLWDADADEVAQQAPVTEVTWAGPALGRRAPGGSAPGGSAPGGSAPGDPAPGGDLRTTLDALGRSGATWAVFDPRAPLGAGRGGRAGRRDVPGGPGRPGWGGDRRAVALTDGVPPDQRAAPLRAGRHQ
jgi:hypothetical protein